MILVGDYVPKDKAVRLSLPKDEFVLANLEAPILGEGHYEPALKAGPSLRSKAIGVSDVRFVFNLANNHMMDYGEDGLIATRHALEERGIPSCGADQDVDEARRPQIVEESGKKIGIIGCCEHQFGCAESNQAGCAGMGLWLLNAIRELKQRCDFVIVSCHAALEHAAVPSPRLREFYRLLIESGADIVHGHHAHVPQGWEFYRGGYIFYGLGNFVVDPTHWRGRNHQWSLVAHIDFSSSTLAVSVSPYGVKEDDETICVQPLLGAELEYAHSYCETWNGVLSNERNYLGAWQATCCALYDILYGPMLKSPHYPETRPLTLRNRLRSAYDGFVNLGSAIAGRRMTNARLQRDGRTLLNLFWCESHVEAISTALAVMSGASGDARDARMRELLLKFELDCVG